MKFIKDTFFNIVNSNKTLFFILINIIAVLGFSIATKSQTMSNHYIIIANEVIDTLGTAMVVVNLGIAIWLYILYTVIKYYSINNDNGIMLTHIVKPISRVKYFFSLFVSIFLAFVVITTINLIISFFVVSAVYNFISFSLFKMFLSTLIFSLWHILFIISILVFIAVIIRSTEFSIILSVLVIILFQAGTYIDVVTQFSFIHYEMFPLGFIYNDIFDVFKYDVNIPFRNVLDVNMFSKYDFALSKSMYDPDLGFAPLVKNNVGLWFFVKSIVFVGLLQAGMIFLATTKFKRMDIQGD